MFFFYQAEDGIRGGHVTGVQTCALPIWTRSRTKSNYKLAWPSAQWGWGHPDFLTPPSIFVSFMIQTPVGIADRGLFLDGLCHKQYGVWSGWVIREHSMS